MKQTVFAVITVASLFLGATSCSQQPSAKVKRRCPLSLRLVKKS